jgi:hypothetical protein
VSLHLTADRPRLVLRIVGWVGVLFALFGLWSDKLDLSICPISQQPAELRAAYYTMAGADIVILIAAFLVAGGLTTGWPKWVPYFVAVQFLVLLNNLVPIWLWSIPHIGHGIAKGPPIYSSGTGLFFLTLYPFWSSLAAVWAAHRMERGKASVPP